MSGLRSPNNAWYDRRVCAETVDCLLQGGADRFGFLRIAVFAPRPEESAQAVLGAPRDHVDVKVRHALTHPIVNGDEGALRIECIFHRAAEQTCVREQGSQHRGRQIHQGGIMMAGNQERVPGKQRAVVEKSQEVGVLENDRRVDFAGRNAAEQAGFRHVFMMPQRSRSAKVCVL